MMYRAINYISWFLLMLILLGMLVLYIIIAYNFSKPDISFMEMQFTNPYYSIITVYPFWIYLVVCFTVLSILFVFIFLSLSLYFSFVKKWTAALKHKYTVIFTSFLSNLFISDHYKTEEQKLVYYKNFRHYFRTKIQLIAFIDTYLRIQETLAVNLSDDFKALIRYFDIQEQIENFLYHRDFDNRILAMKIISYLRIHTHNKTIIKYAQSKNIALRTEAYAALIRLMEHGEHLTNFIGEKHSLSLLDFNIIVNAVLKNNKMDIDYRALLSSGKSRKNMIGLILAKYKFRKSRNNLTLILNHLSSKDEYLKQLAWDALLTLVPEEDAVDIVTDEFEKQSDDIKLSIIRNSKNIVTPGFLNFLSSVLMKQSLILKVEIMRLLYENDFELFSAFSDSEDQDILMVYNEISNLYLLQYSYE